MCDAGLLRYFRAPALGRGRGVIAGLMVAALLLANASCTVRQQPAARRLHEDRDALLDEARRAAQDGRLDDARHCYETLVTKDERDDEARAGLARIDAWSGRYAQSERIYRDVLSRHATDDDVRAGLFNVLVWNHRWNDAELLIHQAPRRDTPGILTLQARLVYARGDVTTARALAERAEVLSGGDPEIRAVKQRLVTRSLRLSARTILLATGAPALGQVDVSLSQSIHRLRLTFETEQGARPTSLSGSWVYGATYGAGANLTFAPGLSFGTEIAVGAPARVVPIVRARSLVTIPIRPWLSSGLGYTFRRFADAVDTHGISPSIGVTLRGELRIDATYWLTHVGLRDRANESASQWIHAMGLSAGRTMLPWLDLRAGYAHGAEAERMPAMFQLLNLVNDSFYVGAKITPIWFFSIEPLYGLALRGPRDGARTAQHTFEIGIVVRQ